MSNKPNIDSHERIKPHTSHGKSEHEDEVVDTTAGIENDPSTGKDATLHQEQDPKRRIGQFGEAGGPPRMNK